MNPALDKGILISGLVFQGGLQYGVIRQRNLPLSSIKQEFRLGPDHWFTYQYKPKYARVSDALVAVQAALPLLAGIPHFRDRNWMNSAVVCSESVLWTLNMTQALKLMQLRTRPLAYALNTPESVKNKTDAHYSFPSGHSSAAFCLATSFSLAMKQMNLQPRTRTILGAASFITAGSIASLRVAAGKHYPTDILAGMVVGCGVALLNHHIHARL